MKKALKLLALVIVSIAALDVLLVFGMANSKPKIERADAIVILGAAINTPALYNRSTEGLRLYEEGKGGVLILSGGRVSPKDMSEAQYMQKVIRSKASGTVEMILEEESHSTFDNIINSKKKVPEAKSAIIVSDKFHVARGVMMARAAGYRHVTWSSPEPYYYSKGNLVWYYFRELAGMVAYVPKFFAN